jgi:type I restriction enzyme S subunit
MPNFQNGASSRGDSGGQLITVLRLADIKERRISLMDTRQIPIATHDISKYRLEAGDILITRVNGSAEIVGQFNLCDSPVDAIYCDHFIRMRIDREWIVPDFCAFLGESPMVRESIQSLFITTAGQKTVNQGHIGSLQFPLPPLAEQSRIVARINELRSLCAGLRQRLASIQTAQLSISNALIGSFNNLLNPIESNGLSN